MKRISIFSAFPPFRGGISHFSSRLTKSLEKNYTVQAYTFKKQYPNWLFPGKSQYDFNQNTVFQNPIKRIVSTFSFPSYFALFRDVNRDTPSIFITNYWMTFFAPMMGFVARKINANTKKIAIVHNFIPHEKRFFDKAFNAYFLKSYDGFVALSQHVYNDITNYVEKEKVILLPHPSYDQFGARVNKPQARKDLQINESKKTLLFFGIIRHYKGLDLLIDAFGSLDDSYQLLIAGEIYGKDDQLIQAIQKNVNAKRIFFRNEFVPDASIPIYFSAADYLILPYRSGTQSGVASIAHTYNLPIIATNTGGIAENLSINKGTIIERPESICIQQAIELAFSQIRSEAEISETELPTLNSWDEFAELLVQFAHGISK